MLKELERNVAIGLEILSIIPQNNITIDQQISDCYKKLSDILKNAYANNAYVVRQVFFIKSNSNEQTIEVKNRIQLASNSFFKNFVPISVIPQSPLENVDISAEFTIASYPDIIKIHTKNAGDLNYLVIETESFTQIIGSGLGVVKPVSDIFEQSIISFEQCEKILANENINFSNIVRQWNYIENIIGYSDKNQHYQIFNDVRTSYYDKCTFSNGYPAATGIGMENGGIIIDFIAIKEKTGVSLTALKSPVQTDAHLYTKEVLAHNNKSIIKNETTPKFERAKTIEYKGIANIFVSGTAAIKGQNSVNYNTAEQTELTLENIFKLVSLENLKNQGIKGDFDTLIPISFRTYVKNQEDLELVKEIFKNRIGSTENIFVKADICRPELLVEIEAIYVAV